MSVSRVLQIRIAQLDDYDNLYKLVTSNKISSFGLSRRRDKTPRDFFRNYATHRLLCFYEDEPSAVLGYAETSTSPNISALPPPCTMDLLRKHYCIDLPLCGTNSLFLNYLVVSNEVRSEALQLIFSEIFFRENQLRFLVVIEPPLPSYSLMMTDPKYLRTKKTRIDFYVLADYETLYYPRVFSAKSCNRTQKVHLIKRDRIIPIMKYRLALPEDNDDLIEIIDVDCPELRKSLGDYFIAEELLKDGNTHTMIVVCEIQNITSGFIWLNDNVDILKIVENYETEPFNNLIKFSPDQPSQTMILRLNTIQKRKPKTLFTDAAIQEIFETSYLGKYLVRSELSAHTLSSQHNLRVLSISGIITTTNERFYLREEFYKKLQKLNDKLKSPSHYMSADEKNVTILYNVPEASVDEFAGIQEHPPDAYPNAVALQLFGMLKMFDSRRIYRILLATFSAFPDREYVLLSMPEGVRVSQNLREILRYFIRVQPRPRGRVPDGLFIAQRTSIYSEIIVHELREEDTDEIDRIIIDRHATGPDLKHDSIVSSCLSSDDRDNDAEADIVHRVIEDIFENELSQFKFMVIRCGSAAKPFGENTIIGFVILRPLQNIELINTHFERLNHEPWQPDLARAEIVLFRLNAFFHFHSDLIFREISHLTEFTDFYYIQPLKTTQAALPNDLVLYMQPVEPRRYKNVCNARPQWLLSEENSETSKVLPRLNLATDYFALYRHNLGTSIMLGSDKLIVVVGFSALCQAFLRLMIFNWNTNNTRDGNNLDCLVPALNIIVITGHGVVEAAYDAHFCCKYCSDQGDCWVNRSYWNDFTRDCTQRIDLRKWIRFVSGRIFKIDRSRKTVVLQNSCEIYYDVLLLLCETDFNLPKAVANVDRLPSNLIQVNSRLDRIMVYHKLRVMEEDLKTTETPIILVYGAHLRAMEFIEFLLTHNVDPKSIILAMPYQLSLLDAQKVLNQPVADEKIECIVTTMLQDMGVKILERLRFSRWMRYKEDDSISHVIFKKINGEELSIECDFFVNYYESHLDWHMIDVLNRYGIKTNRRCIAVDAKFCTNDPNIYAMGNYVECHSEPNHQYKYISHMEQAEKLIQILDLLPFRTKDFELKYTRPHSMQVRLPKSYEMMKVSMPKRYLENHLSNEFSRSFVTYDGTFCRVRLNEYGILEEIVCVTPRRMSFEFLLHFVGRHETLLNNLRARWCQEEITCFLDYFQEPWAELIMHERFADLLERNKSILLPVLESNMNLNMTRRERNDKFFQHANEIDLHRQLEDAFIAFLRKYRSEFVCQFALPEDFPTQTAPNFN